MKSLHGGRAYAASRGEHSAHGGSRFSPASPSSPSPKSGGGAV